MTSKRDRYLRKTYGITNAQYEEMLEIQQYACAICLRPARIGQKRLAVDHCHKTGKVRGICCWKCNYGIGVFRDNPIYLRRAAEYLERSLAD